MADKVKLLVLCGPTATGKTALAVRLAQKLDGEVLSADSMQIYRGLRVGTAAPTEQEMQGIPHHLVGFLPPEERFSVADWVRCAQACIREIAGRGKTPIVAGGTGLYLTSLVEGIRFAPQTADLSVRARLQKELEADGIEPLYDRLVQIDPAYAATVHKNNHGRVLRALELYEQTGKTMTRQRQDSRPEERPYDARIWALDYPDRITLYAKIGQRVDRMMQEGLLQEARTVYEHRADFQTAAQAIGYKEFFDYFEGRADVDACVELLKQSTRRYAKRQLTWFRRMEGVRWENAGDPAAADRIQEAFLR